MLLEEKDAVTTVLASSRKFLEQRRDLVRRVVAAHAALTHWILANPAEARDLIRQELEAETRAKVSAGLVAHAWPRIILTNRVSRDALETFVAKAKDAGFLRGTPDLARLVETP